MRCFCMVRVVEHRSVASTWLALRRLDSENAYSLLKRNVTTDREEDERDFLRKNFIVELIYRGHGKIFILKGNTCRSTCTLASSLSPAGASDPSSACNRCSPSAPICCANAVRWLSCLGKR